MTRLAIVAVTMLLGGEARAEDGKLLRWKMTAGQKWGVVLTQKVETETSFGDKPLKLAIDTTLDQDWHVTSVDEAGTATIEQAFRRIQVRMDLPPSGAVDFDSAVPRPAAGEAKQLAGSLKPLIGPKFTVRMSNRGEFLDFQSSPELDQALAGLTEKSPLRELFTREGLTDLVRQGLIVLPEKTVKPGDEWQASREVHSGIGRVKQSTTYRYEGEAKLGAQALDKITATSKLEWTGPARSSTNRELKRQRQTGTLFFNATQGQFVDSELSQQLRTESRVRDTLIETQLTSSLRVKVALSAE